MGQAESCIAGNVALCSALPSAMCELPSQPGGDRPCERPETREWQSHKPDATYPIVSVLLQLSLSTAESAVQARSTPKNKISLFMQRLRLQATDHFCLLQFCVCSSWHCSSCRSDRRTRLGICSAAKLPGLMQCFRVVRSQCRLQQCWFGINSVTVEMQTSCGSSAIAATPTWQSVFRRGRCSGSAALQRSPSAQHLPDRHRSLFGRTIDARKQLHQYCYAEVCGWFAVLVGMDFQQTALSNRHRTPAW